ncbi:MAG: hypothetical protein HQM16_18480 [Deltaproteobacteria bacterium]|nr:hypothetical protein [Deltaproteobacteria bacterium]
MQNNTKPSLTTANLFKNKPDLILRTMLKDTRRGWTGPELATALNISSAWAARVLATLEFERFATRDGKRSQGRVFLSNVDNLKTRWKLSYHITFNRAFSYRVLTKNPTSLINSMAKKEGFKYAVTGQAAKAIKKGRAPVLPLPVYVDTNNTPHDIFTLLNKLEDKYDLIPTHKNPNLIILDPHVGEGVFFDASIKDGVWCVSDLQIELDTNDVRGGVS